MKRLFVAPEADADLRAIFRWIAADNPARAGTFTDELRAKALRAGERPHSFRRRPDLGPDIRSVVHGRYLILFRDLPDRVVILRFVHGAQNLSALRYD